VTSKYCLLKFFKYIQVLSFWNKPHSFSSGIRFVWFTGCTIWRIVSMTIKWLIGNLKNQTFWKACLILKLSQILIKILIFSVMKIFMWYIFAFGSWTVIMIFSSAEKNSPNIQDTLFLVKPCREYFLRQLENSRMLKKWVSVILFGLFSVLRTKQLSKVYNTGLKLWT